MDSPKKSKRAKLTAEKNEETSNPQMVEFKKSTIEEAKKIMDEKMLVKILSLRELNSVGFIENNET